MKKANRKEWKDMSVVEKIVGTIGVTIAGFILIGIIGAIVSPQPDAKKEEVKPANEEKVETSVKKPEAPQPAPAKAIYNARLGAYNAVDPATLAVAVIVKNTSAVTGKPSCFVSVGNSSNTYKGYDQFDFNKELSPSEEYIFPIKLTITNEGAAYVTEGSVECE